MNLRIYTALRRSSGGQLKTIGNLYFIIHTFLYFLKSYKMCILYVLRIVNVCNEIQNYTFSLYIR